MGRVRRTLPAMGIRTRGIDIKVGAKRHRRKARPRRAKAVVERWNEQLAASRERSPTIRVALTARIAALPTN
jgi:hypothetical protein